MCWCCFKLFIYCVSLSILWFSHQNLTEGRLQLHYLAASLKCRKPHQVSCRQEQQSSPSRYHPFARKHPRAANPPSLAKFPKRLHFYFLFFLSLFFFHLVLVSRTMEAVSLTYPFAPSDIPEPFRVLVLAPFATVIFLSLIISRSFCLRNVF